MARQIYKLEDGTRVSGVTTIIETLGWNKRTLMNWANRIGLEGIDSNKYTDGKARIGTLTHQMIMDYLLVRETNTKDYSQNEIDAATNSMFSFLKWEETHGLQPIVIEVPRVSEELKYGGTPDYLGYVNNELELLDFKTGSGIYDEHIIQVVAYRSLVIETTDKQIDSKAIRNMKVRILNIPRTEDESFTEKILSQKEIELGWQVFLHCLELYNLQKEWNKFKKQ